ncbi:MAG: hypothetical protein B7Y78_01195, partial [Caulobacter sp. 35-67-4]
MGLAIGGASAIAVAFWHLLVSGELLTALSESLRSFFVGYLLAIVVGIPIGLVLGRSRVAEAAFGIYITAGYAMPLVALVPLLMLWLGLGFASKFVLVLMVAVFPVVVTTEAGLRAADKPLIEAARSFNATKWQIFTTVTFPYALPFIVSGVRVAWARALVGIVVAEFFGSFAGFGFAILSASQTFDTARVLGYVFVLGAMGLIGSVSFAALERHL